MEEQSILLDIKQKLLITLKKWEHNTDWFYFKEVTAHFMKPDTFSVWFGIRIKDQNFITMIDFHFLRGFREESKLPAVQNTAFESKKFVSEELGKIMNDVNRETAIDRFLYKKYLEKNLKR